MAVETNNRLINRLVSLSPAELDAAFDKVWRNQDYKDNNTLGNARLFIQEIDPSLDISEEEIGDALTDSTFRNSTLFFDASTYRVQEFQIAVVENQKY